MNKGDVNMPSEQAIALFTNVFGYAPDPEALHAGECWQVERIDAALRRAKVEVLRELTQSLTYTRFNSYEQGMCERGYGLTKEEKIGASIGLAWARGEIDARAAQIEEGEDLK